MWPFNTAAKKAFKKAQERDNCFQVLKTGAENSDRYSMSTSVLTLLELHLDDPRVSPAIVAALNILAEKDLAEAIGFSIYLVTKRDYRDKTKNTHLEKIQHPAVEKSFELMPRIDKNDAREMAGVAMLSNAIVDISKPGSDMETRAIRQWEEAMDVLTAKSIGHALAAACNAVCGSKSQTLANLATTKFETALADLALTDKPTAADLANSFRQKCLEFDAPQKQRAAALVNSLS